MHFLIGLAIIVVLLALFPRALAQVVGWGLLLLTIVVMAAIGGGSSQKAAQQQSAVAAEKAQEDQKVRDAEDLKRCGPPDPDWSVMELQYLSVCEAATKPPAIPGGDVYDYNCGGTARSCLLHKQLSEERDRRAEAERRAKAEKARRDWLASPEGRNRAGAVQTPSQSIDLPITIQAPVSGWSAAKELLPTPAPEPINAPAGKPLAIHERSFESFIDNQSTTAPAAAPRPRNSGCVRAVFVGSCK